MILRTQGKDYQKKILKFKFTDIPVLATISYINWVSFFYASFDLSPLHSESVHVLFLMN